MKKITRKCWLGTRNYDNKQFITKVYFEKPKLAYVASFRYTYKGKLKVAPIFEDEIIEAEISYPFKSNRKKKSHAHTNK